MPVPASQTVAMFYHLMRGGLTDTMTMILGRATGQGWRVMIRCPDGALAQKLDDLLWLPEGSFVPHGQAMGKGTDARQPVLIGPGAAVNAPRGLMLLAGADVLPDDPADLERIWLLFDGADEGAVAHARSQWTDLTAQGLAAQYWSDETGAWVKKTDRAAQTQI